MLLLFWNVYIFGKEVTVFKLDNYIDRLITIFQIIEYHGRHTNHRRCH